MPAPESVAAATNSGSSASVEGPAVSSATSVSYESMADSARTVAQSPRPAVKLSLRSALAIVGAFAVTVLLLEIALDARRVLAWTLTAIAVAALVQPLVAFFQRFMARGLAVLVVVVLVPRLDRLRRLPHRARGERADEAPPRGRAGAGGRARSATRSCSGRSSFSDRVERLADTIPERLRGGTTAEAIRSAANRGLALLAGVVLTLFFVLYGPALVDGAFAQIRNPRRRRRVEHDRARRRAARARLRAGEGAHRRRRRSPRLRDRARGRCTRARRARGMGGALVA